MIICKYICLFVCLFICMYVYMFVSLFVCMYVNMFVCLCVCVCVCVCVWLSGRGECRNNVWIHMHLPLYTRICSPFGPGDHVPRQSLRGKRGLGPSAWFFTSMISSMTIYFCACTHAHSHAYIHLCILTLHTHKFFLFSSLIIPLLSFTILVLEWISKQLSGSSGRNHLHQISLFFPRSSIYTAAPSTH